VHGYKPRVIIIIIIIIIIKTIIAELSSSISPPYYITDQISHLWTKERNTMEN
jgi:hypothetical protein